LAATSFACDDKPYREMYAGIAPTRKRVATLLLRLDHTEPQTFAHNSMQRPGRRDSAVNI
jgi:hypothetical protein